MKDFKKSHDIAGQSNMDVQKQHKHDANLQKNSSLYFQIGLILCLLGTYGLFEMKFENRAYEIDSIAQTMDENMTIKIKTYVVEENIPKKKPIKHKKQKLINDPVILDDNRPIDVTTEIIDPNTFNKIEKPVIIDTPFNLDGVEIVPIYPGCEDETNNTDRIKCMNEKIGKLVQRKFDTGLAQELGLTGVQRINVQFKINKQGEVVDILTRAPHPSLEKEAERLTKRIPTMKPGLQRKEPVSVLYNLPIVFKVQD